MTYYALSSRTSTITVEAAQFCRSLIETTAINLEAYLADVKEKLEILTSRLAASTQSKKPIVQSIESERFSTEKGLQLCLALAQYIDEL